MIAFASKANQEIQIDKNSIVGKGGESKVFRLIGNRDLVAKIYTDPQGRSAEKILAMLENPPNDPTRKLNHNSIAWPIDILYSLDGSTVLGFLMPFVDDVDPLNNFYNPHLRKRLHPNYTYARLHRAARNIAAGVEEIHAKGYVIGDLKESNVLLTSGALATFVDTDSFQVPKPDSNDVFHCPVGSPFLTPPENQRKKPIRQKLCREHDNFSLGVLIFHLLMEGWHPFMGVSPNSDLVPDRIRKGHFPYQPENLCPVKPPPRALPFDSMDKEIRSLFMRCFCEGHTAPEARPSASEWKVTLGRAEKKLVRCKVKTGHEYYPHNGQCTWCEQASRPTISPSLPPLPKSKKQKQHICRDCNQHFESKSSLKKHRKKAHPPITFDCSICGKKLNSEKRLKAHQRKKHISKDYHCNDCEKRFATADGLEVHRQQMHPVDGVFGCRKCSETFRSHKELLKHVSKQHPAKAYACGKCNKHFKSPEGLSIHMQTAHGQYSCASCGKSFPDKFRLKQHRKNATKCKKFACPHCSSRFHAPHTLKQHIERNHTKKLDADLISASGNEDEWIGCAVLVILLIVSLSVVSVWLLWPR